jgi:hypothetical protein
MHTAKRTHLTVGDLPRSIVYRPLAIILAILMLPAVSWMESGTAGPRAFQASATLTDTTAPTAPGSLTVTADSFAILGQVTFNGLVLSWAASADPDSPNVTYHVERDLVTVGTSSETGWSELTTTTTTSYEDTDQLLASTTGSSPTISAFYRVRAADPVGNYSGYSNTVQYPRSTSVSNPIFQSFVPCRTAGCLSFGYDPDLTQLESDAVNAYLAAHNLPAADGHIVYDYGRADLRDAIRGNMLSILLGIIQKAPSSRTQHEQNLYNWLQGLVQGNEVDLYTAAISQYQAWQRDPCHFTLDPHIASALNTSYDGSPWCQPGSLIPPSPTVPSQGYFIAYGMQQSYGKDALQYSNFTSIVSDTSVNVTEVAGIFTAAGVILVALATGLLAASFSAVTAFAVSAAATLGGLAATSAAFTLSASSIAAIGGVAAAAAGVAAIVLIGVAIGVAALIELLDYDNTISALNALTVPTAAPDLTTFLDSTGQFKLNQTLVSQTLPDVPSTAALPAHQSGTDLIFGITPQNSTETTSNTLSYIDWNGVNWSAQTYGGWFVQNCTGFASPATSCPQADSIIASIRYVDWNGVNRIASRIGDKFVITKQNPVSTDTFCPADQNSGITLSPSSSCLSYVDKQIQLKTPDGILETVRLLLLAPTTTTISAPTITYNTNG